MDASSTVSCAIAPKPIEGLDMELTGFDTVAFTVHQETLAGGPYEPTCFMWRSRWSKTW